jgi:hypothetical protein
MSFINRAAPPVKTVMAALVLAIVGGLGIFGAGQIAFGSGPSDPSFVPHANSCVSRWGFIRVVSDTANCSKWEKPLLIASEEKVDDVITRVEALENAPAAGGIGTTYVNISPYFFSCPGTCQVAGQPVEVDCNDASDIATGGGYLVASNPSLAVGMSQPKGFGAGVNIVAGQPAHGWRVQGENAAYNTSGNNPGGLIAYVVCVEVP